MSDAISFDAPEPDELSAHLDNYDVSSLIAVGGMGAVYHANQTSLDRDVAIKLLPAEFGGDAFRAQFATEAKAMAKLNHPNLIAIYDFGETDGLPYIVMEFVPGKSLYYSCYKKAIEQSEAIRLTSEICAGLGHAHGHGIIHRDIKPANILLDSHAHAKIGDFGLASGTDDDNDSGLIYGTPDYAAPEILQDAANVGIPSDIFAVGVILHLLLTGKMPKDDPRVPSRIGGCDTRLDRIVRKATRGDPAERYQTCEEMLKDLRAIPNRSARKIITAAPPATKPSLLKRTAATAAPLEKTKASDSPNRPRLRKLEPSDRPTSDAAFQETPPAVIALAPSTNWPLVRNLMIIALLVPALIFAWGIYKEREKDRAAIDEKERIEKENIEREQKVARENVLRAAEEKKIAAVTAKKKRKEDAIMVEETIAKEPKLTPLEQLDKYKGSLVGGVRDVFPEGTIERGDISLFFVETPMSWSAASEFAESHGGHLATPALTSDLSWIAEKQGDVRRIWLGGGALGFTDWGWVTGAEWNHKKPSTSLGTCAAMTNTGIISARPNGENLPFFIQWENDGTNEGALDAQLNRLKGTLGAPSPAWPPGTLAYDGRNYLLVQRALPWDEADLIATSAGGHLAVPSNSVEKDYLSETLSNFLTLNQSAWLGGRLVEGNWTWITGEKWDKPSWRESSPDGGKNDSALRFTSAGEDSGWDDAHPDEYLRVNAFFIEWSNDAKNVEPEAAKDGNGALIKTKIMAAKLLRGMAATHLTRLKDNQKNMIWSIDSWMRGQKKPVIRTHSPNIATFKNNLPDDGSVSNEIKGSALPGPVIETIQDAVARQGRFDNKLQADILNLRNNYLAKLLAEQNRFEKSNLKVEIAAIEKEIQDVGQGSAPFRAYLGVSD